MTENLSLWHHATMRDKMLDLKSGDQVFVARSAFRFTHPQLNPSYWIAVPDQQICYQVAEFEFGKRLYNLIKIGEQLKKGAQDKVSARCKELMQDSVFSPKGRRLQQKYMDAVHKHRTRTERSTQ